MGPDMHERSGTLTKKGRPLGSKPPISDRNRMIREEYTRGVPITTIARSLSMTKQRVDQIVAPIKMPVEKRPRLTQPRARTLRVCRQCARSYEVSHQRRGGHRGKIYCSRRCLGDAMREGPNAASWKRARAEGLRARNKRTEVVVDPEAKAAMEAMDVVKSVSAQLVPEILAREIPVYLARAGKAASKEGLKAHLFLAVEADGEQIWLSFKAALEARRAEAGSDGSTRP
jgi:hypothetical protein